MDSATSESTSSQSPPVDRASSTSELGAWITSLLLLASSFGLASAEDARPPADDAREVGEAGGTAADDGEDMLAQLTIAPEVDGSDYDRDAFKHWVDADGDGCDARQEVLLVEAEEGVDPECPVERGEWISLYDGVVVTEPSLLDIDHMVPLKEAWESSASSWTAQDREAYANDLDEPDALIAVTASTNRSKSDRDPAHWQPPDSSTWCVYATSWIRVKVKWSLNADEAEVAALRDMLATCPT